MNARNLLSLGLAPLALLALTNLASAQAGLSGEDIGALGDGSDVTPPYGDPEIDRRGSSDSSRGSGSLEDDDLSDASIDDGSIDRAAPRPRTSADDFAGGSIAKERSRRDVVEECTADSNGDGYVGFNDLVALVTAWGVCPVGDGATGEEPDEPACPADFTHDRRVDFHDLTILLLSYGNSCLDDALLP